MGTAVGVVAAVDGGFGGGDDDCGGEDPAGNSAEDESPPEEPAAARTTAIATRPTLTPTVINLARRLSSFHAGSSICEKPDQRVGNESAGCLGSSNLMSTSVVRSGWASRSYRA